MIPALLLALVAQSDVAPPPSLAVGLAIGEPVGFSVAAPVRGSFRVHLTAGLSPSDERDALATFDFGYDLPNVIGPVFGTGRLVPWFGLGVRYADARREEDSDKFGLRVPFGMSYYDLDGTIEMFAMVAYGVVLMPETDHSLDVTAGLRFGL